MYQYTKQQKHLVTENRDELNDSSTSALLDLLTKHVQLSKSNTPHQFIDMSATFSSVATRIAIALPQLHVTTVAQEPQQFNVAKQRLTELRKQYKHFNLLNNLNLLHGDSESASELINSGTILYKFDTIASPENLLPYIQSTTKWQYIVTNTKPSWWTNHNCHLIKCLDTIRQIRTVSSTSKYYTLYLYQRDTEYHSNVLVTYV